MTVDGNSGARGAILARNQRERVVLIALASRAGSLPGSAQSGTDHRTRGIRRGDLEGDLRQAELLIGINRKPRTRDPSETKYAIVPTIVLVATVIDGISSIPDAGELAVLIRLPCRIHPLHHGSRIGVEARAWLRDAQVGDLHALRQGDVVLHARRALAASRHRAWLDGDGEGLARLHPLWVAHVHSVGGKRQLGCAPDDTADSARILHAFQVDLLDSRGHRGRTRLLPDSLIRLRRSGHDQPQGQSDRACATHQLPRTPSAHAPVNRNPSIVLVNHCTKAFLLKIPVRT